MTAGIKQMICAVNILRTTCGHAFCSGHEDAKNGFAFPNRIYLERRYPNKTSRDEYEKGFYEFIDNHQPF